MFPIRLVYLAGPIAGLPYDQTVDWRKYAAEKFPPHIIGVSPMRGKEYLKDEKMVGMSYEDIPMSSRKGITGRDGFDVEHADAVLAYFLGAKNVSIGTVFEMGIAYGHGRIATVMVLEENNPHQHAMLIASSVYVVSNLDDAIHLLTVMLTPGL